MLIKDPRQFTLVWSCIMAKHQHDQENECTKVGDQVSQIGAPQCICGVKMILVAASDCYSSPGVGCDLCDRHLGTAENVYHCPKGPSDKHLYGYDICVSCKDEGSKCAASSCPQIIRIISALTFYSTIDPINNKKHESKFMEYCNEIYPELLDDYVHIMDNHQNDIEQVLKSRIRSDTELMHHCNIQNCVAISRHYRDRERQRIKQTLWKCQHCELRNYATNNHCQACFIPQSVDTSFNLVFYIDLIDSVHCHWYHAFDLGLRSSIHDENGQEIGKLEVLKNRLGKKKFSLPTIQYKMKSEGITIYHL